MTFQKDYLFIVNRALAKIGNSMLTSLDDENQTAILCKTLLRESVLEIVEKYPWRCMIQRKYLSPSVNTPAFGFKYKYELPNNFARVVKVFTENEEKWVRESGCILTDSPSLGFVYVEIPLDADKLTPEVEELIVLRLAYNLNQSITTNTTLSNLLLNEFTNALAMAKNNDAGGEEDIKEFCGWVDRR